MGFVLADHVPGPLVFTEAKIDGVPHLAGARPFGKLHFGHEEGLSSAIGTIPGQINRLTTMPGKAAPSYKMILGAGVLRSVHSENQSRSARVAPIFLKGRNSSSVISATRSSGTEIDLPVIS